MRRTTKKYAVDRTRITWVLAALVASMTIGTIVLGVLQPSKFPRSEKTTYLAATYNSASSSKISRTSIPIETNLWKTVVIHAIAPQGQDDLVLRCLPDAPSGTGVAHFGVTPDGKILVNRSWRNQEVINRYPGQVMIALQLGPGQSDATLVQAEALVTIIRDLQVRCNIAASNILLHSQLSSNSCAKDPLNRYNWRQALLP